jgi:hypothetical protein
MLSSPRLRLRVAQAFCVETIAYLSFVYMWASGLSMKLETGWADRSSEGFLSRRRILAEGGTGHRSIRT